MSQLAGKCHRIGVAIVGLAIVGLVLCFPATSDAAETQAENSSLVQFDLGSTKWQASGHWNVLTDHERLGVLNSGAVDSQGRSTTLAVRQIDGWSGINSLGHTGDGPFPPEAMRDSFYLGDDDRHAALRLEGLVPGGEYKLTFYGSRLGGEQKRTTHYRVGDLTAELNTADNKTISTEISKAVANEQGQLTIEIDCPDGEDYGYLGALVIAGEFPTAEESLQPADPLNGPPIVTCAAWIVGDGKTGQRLWGAMDNVPRQMASTTKIMTAVLVLEEAEKDKDLLDETVTVSARADRTGGSTAGIQVGEQYLVRELLYGLLLPSGNDAAVALAEHVGNRFPLPEGDADEPQPDSLARFVAAMNAKAETLGMQATRYFDPHGNSANRSSASDLLRLAHHAIQLESLRQYVGTRQMSVSARGPNGAPRKVTWNNTNKLLGIEGFDGIKTGTTRQAGACLVSSGHRNGTHLIVVVLGSTSTDARYVDSRNLYRWAWQQTAGQTKNDAEQAASE